jgi:hypothetical protein
MTRVTSQRGEREVIMGGFVCGGGATESPLGAIVTRDTSHPSGRRVGVAMRGAAMCGWARCVPQYAKIESDFLLRFVCWGRSFINIQVKKR